MTAPTEDTKRKLSLLQLIQQRGNVSKARQLMGHRRSILIRAYRDFADLKASVSLDPKKSQLNYVSPSSCLADSAEFREHFAK